MFRTCGRDIYIPTKKILDVARGTQPDLNPVSARRAYPIPLAKKLLADWLTGQSFTAIGEHRMVM